jgi:class 3 adenylate cyclase
MNLKELIAEAEGTLRSKWETRVGRKIPEADEVQSGADAVILDGTVLYADLVDSTGLVDRFKPRFAAKVYKTYLAGASQIIRDNGGQVTAFDGDRVMAVYIGDRKNTYAAKTALQINAYVRKLNRTIKAVYPNTTYVLQQAVGIDTSSLFVAKTGIWGYNDLVWVGRAANYAAKLCALADATNPSCITEDVYEKLADTSKSGGAPRRAMWEKQIWEATGLVIYRSNWWWDF